MSHVPPEPGTAQNAVKRVRAAFEYDLGGDLRYLAHSDELRMLVRALTRAAWPLRYTGGFNPTPQISIPLPRSVGTAAECQWALVALSEERATDELAGQLAPTLPKYCTLKQVICPATNASPQPAIVSYRVALDALDAGAVKTRVQRLLAADELVVSRMRGPRTPARELDIRPYVDTLTLDGTELSMRLKFVAQQSARPIEIVTNLGLAADDYRHRVVRTEVVWNLELADDGGNAAALRGTTFVCSESNTNHEET